MPGATKFSIPIKPPARLFSPGKVHLVVHRLVVERLSLSQWLAIGPLPKERQRQKTCTGYLIPVCPKQWLLTSHLFDSVLTHRSIKGVTLVQVLYGALLISKMEQSILKLMKTSMIVMPCRCQRVRACAELDAM